MVDQACRGLFPLGFLICNGFYWLYYLKLTGDDGDDDDGFAKDGLASATTGDLFATEATPEL